MDVPQGVVTESGGWVAAESGRGAAKTEMGRRFYSGFMMSRDGIPPCDTMVGGFDAEGKGTKV